MVWSFENETGKLASGRKFISYYFDKLGNCFFEYLFLVPANRIGFIEDGGPFTLWQLKVVQEVITLTVFTAFTLIFFKGQPLKMNHLIGFGFLVLAVYFIF